MLRGAERAENRLIGKSPAYLRVPSDRTRPWRRTFVAAARRCSARLTVWAGRSSRNDEHAGFAIAGMVPNRWICARYCRARTG